MIILILAWICALILPALLLFWWGYEIYKGSIEAITAAFIVGLIALVIACIWGWLYISNHTGNNSKPALVEIQ